MVKCHFSQVNNVKNSACKLQRYSQTAGQISLCYGVKLEESKEYNYFFIIFYVLKLK